MVQDTPPRTRILAASRRLGERAFVAECVAILEGTGLDLEVLEALGGTSTRAVLAGREGGTDGHWPRVWALRGLRYVWDPAAELAVLHAGEDENWRVREVTATVIRVHALHTAGSQRLLRRLADDPIDRVARAAERALRERPDTA